MSDGKIIIHPKALEKEIENCRKGIGPLEADKIEVKYSYSELDHIKMLEKYAETMNGIIKQFCSLAEKDMVSLEKIKGQWMNVDEELAQKTLGDIIFNKNN